LRLLLTFRAIFDLLFLQPLSAAARRWALVSFPRRRLGAAFRLVEVFFRLYGLRFALERLRVRAAFLAAALRLAALRFRVAAAFFAAAL
jgi:hypothetical protein